MVNRILILKEFLQENLIINRLILHSADCDFQEISSHTALIISTDNITKQNICGLVEKSYFALNLQSITEAQNNNTCLNKKMFIDQNGNIRNCPFSKEIFDNILSDNILNIVRSKKFQKLWHITKDKIEVCKDCEFRYICTQYWRRKVF
jgi:radical SAM protein with 4Fe4S-binding SPASM domain